MLNESQIQQHLGLFEYPKLAIKGIDSKSLGYLELKRDKVRLELNFDFPIESVKKNLHQALTTHFTEQYPQLAFEFILKQAIQTHCVREGLKPINGIKNIIAVASGKGGVGKSTTSINLAIALSQQGARVGILDADIYGPSIPKMLDVNQQPESPDGKTMNPIEQFGLQCMSIGFLIDEDTPMIWRGPMVTQALNQLFNDTRWDNLDYLLIDLPPGTGDVQLTLAQKIPVTGAVIVTTPQDIALLDARKGLKMFSKVDIPTLGVVENMSYHICSECGHKERIFGQGGGNSLASSEDVTLLGELPLELSIRECADQGTPIVQREPDSPISYAYHQIATNVAVKLSELKKDYAAKFGEIKIS